MSKSYGAPNFVGFCFGVLLLHLAAWFVTGGQLPQLDGAWVTIVPTAAGVIGMPCILARVSLNDEGIKQHLFKRHFVRWADVISLERRNRDNSDGPDAITIKTDQDSITLDHNCIYGKRVDEVGIRVDEANHFEVAAV